MGLNFYSNINYKGGGILAFEIIKQITEIEREGDEIVKNAQLHAMEVQKEARIDAEKIIQNAKKEADEYYKAIILKYEQEAIELSKFIMEESERTINNIKNIPTELIDRAANMVIERIVNSHGNS
jgi:vacuolar-type H+-ATPase subunit H